MDGTADFRGVRSAGVLEREDFNALAAQGGEISYDPVQIGWVRSDVIDDIPVRYKPMPFGGSPGAKAAPYTLRHWRDSDLADYIALLDNPEIWRFMPEPYPAPLTQPHAATLIELSNISNHHEVFAVIQNRKPIGQVRLLFGAEGDANGTAELSYWLGQDHWNQGHGTRIVRLYAQRCFADHPGIAALIARVHPDNIASLRVLERAGFAQASSRDASGTITLRLERP